MRHESDKAENEYQGAWAVYVKQHKMTKQDMVCQGQVEKCE